MSNTFRVTTEHIDNWYEENRWWVDELKVVELLRLCGIFYIYQVLEQDRDGSLKIQEKPDRRALAEHLKGKLKTQKSNISNSALSNTDLIYTTPSVLSSVDYVHPFYNNKNDIIKILKNKPSEDICTVNTKAYFRAFGVRPKLKIPIGSVTPPGSPGTPSGSAGSVAPPGSTGLVTPPGSTGLVTPPGSTGLVTPPGSTGSVAPPGSTGSVAPPGSTGLVTPPGSTGLVTPPGSTGSVAPPGSTGSVAPSGSPAPVLLPLPLPVPAPAPALTLQETMSVALKKIMQFWTTKGTLSDDEFQNAIKSLNLQGFDEFFNYTNKLTRTVDIPKLRKAYYLYIKTTYSTQLDELSTDDYKNIFGGEEFTDLEFLEKVPEFGNTDYDTKLKEALELVVIYNEIKNKPTILSLPDPNKKKVVNAIYKVKSAIQPNDTKSENLVELMDMTSDIINKTVANDVLVSLDTFLKQVNGIREMIDTPYIKYDTLADDDDILMQLRVLYAHVIDWICEKSGKKIPKYKDYYVKFIQTKYSGLKIEYKFNVNIPKISTLEAVPASFMKICAYLYYMNSIDIKKVPRGIRYAFDVIYNAFRLSYVHADNVAVFDGKGGYKLTDFTPPEVRKINVINTIERKAEHQEIIYAKPGEYYTYLTPIIDNMDLTQFFSTIKEYNEDIWVKLSINKNALTYEGIVTLVTTTIVGNYDTFLRITVPSDVVVDDNEYRRFYSCLISDLQYESKFLTSFSESSAVGNYYLVSSTDKVYGNFLQQIISVALNKETTMKTFSSLIYKKIKGWPLIDYTSKKDGGIQYNDGGLENFATKCGRDDEGNLTDPETRVNLLGVFFGNDYITEADLIDPALERGIVINSVEKIENKLKDYKGEEQKWNEVIIEYTLPGETKKTHTPIILTKDILITDEDIEKHVNKISVNDYYDNYKKQYTERPVEEEKKGKKGGSKKTISGPVPNTIVTKNRSWFETLLSERVYYLLLISIVLFATAAYKSPTSFQLRGNVPSSDDIMSLYTKKTSASDALPLPSASGSESITVRGVPPLPSASGSDSITVRGVPPLPSASGSDSITVSAVTDTVAIVVENHPQVVQQATSVLQKNITEANTIVVGTKDYNGLEEAAQALSPTSPSVMSTFYSFFVLDKNMESTLIPEFDEATGFLIPLQHSFTTGKQLDPKNFPSRLLPQVSIWNKNLPAVSKVVGFFRSIPKLKDRNEILNTNKSIKDTASPLGIFPVSLENLFEITSNPFKMELPSAEEVKDGMWPFTSETETENVDTLGEDTTTSGTGKNIRVKIAEDTKTSARTTGGYIPKKKRAPTPSGFLPSIGKLIAIATAVSTIAAVATYTDAFGLPASSVVNPSSSVVVEVSCPKESIKEVDALKTFCRNVVGNQKTKADNNWDESQKAGKDMSNINVELSDAYLRYDLYNELESKVDERLKSCKSTADGYAKKAGLRSRKRRTDGSGNITRTKNPNRSRRGGGKPKRSRDGGKLKAVLRSIRNSLRKESDDIAIPKTNKRSNKQRGRRADGGDLLMVNTPVIPYNTCKVWK